MAEMANAAIGLVWPQIRRNALNIKGEKKKRANRGGKGTEGKKNTKSEGTLIHRMMCHPSITGNTFSSVKHLADFAQSVPFPCESFAGSGAGSGAESRTNTHTYARNYTLIHTLMS